MRWCVHAHLVTDQMSQLKCMYTDTQDIISYFAKLTYLVSAAFFKMQTDAHFPVVSQAYNIISHSPLFGANVRMTAAAHSESQF